MGPLHRARWGPAIQRYADEELGATRTLTVARHLTDCADCTGELRAVRRVKSSLQRLGERRPPELAVARLRVDAAHLGSA